MGQFKKKVKPCHHKRRDSLPASFHKPDWNAGSYCRFGNRTILIGVKKPGISEKIEDRYLVLDELMTGEDNLVAELIIK